MSYFKNKLILFLLISLCGCINTQQVVVKDIRKCMQERGKSQFEEINFITTYIKIERIFIQEHLLKDSSKQAYLNAMLLLTKQKDAIGYANVVEKVKNSVDKSVWLDAPSNFNASVRCNTFIIQKHNLENDAYYKEYYQALLEFDKSGQLDNWIINKKLLETTPDFDKIEFRMPIISILYMNILN